jgi:hypothetical protein
MARRILIVARWAMSLVGMVYLFSYWRILDFTWHGQRQWLGNILCWGLIALLALRAPGWGDWFTDRVLSVLHFAGAQYLLTRTFPYATVNEGLYLILAFWCCFIRLNPPPDAEIPAWAPFLLGINISILFFTSGMDKYVDPLWGHDGCGLYHFLRLAWIRPPSADWIMSHVRALEFMNWAALAMELAVLPLMLYWRTRPIACALLGGFFASLIWPCRMDMIGPVGLCIVLVILAGSLPMSRMKMSGMAWIMALYVLIAGTSDISSLPAWRHFKSREMWKRISFLAGGWYPPSAQWLNYNATMMVPNQLFTSEHIMNINAFRVLVTMPDGTIQEPIRVFTADRKGGPDTQGIACTRHYQSMVYSIGAVLNRRSYPPHSEDNLDALLTHAIRKAGGVSATLVISPLDKPFDGWTPMRSLKAPRPGKEPRPDLFAVGVLALLGITLTARRFCSQRLPRM